MFSSCTKSPPQSLEAALLYNALRQNHRAEEAVKISVQSDWMGPTLGILLLLPAVVYLLLKSEFPAGILEALFIAGVLTLTVDPFLKERLHKGATKDMFHHLLGFDLPLPIKNRIKDIVLGTKIYRKDMHMAVSFVRSGSGIRMECSVRFEVVNPTRDSLKFRHSLAFEKPEKPRLLCVALTTDSNHGKGATLEDGDEPGVLEWHRDATIKPENSGKRYFFSASYTVEYPDHWFHVQNFGHPTIGASLEVNSKPADLEITATPGSTQTLTTWTYQRLFMPEEHIQIRWRPTGSQ